MNSNNSRVIFSVLAVFLAIVLGSVCFNRKNGTETPERAATAVASSGDTNSTERGSHPTSQAQTRQSKGDSTGKAPTVFGLNGAVQLDDVPGGRFHEELARLDNRARRAALDKLGALQVPLNDVASLGVDREGGLFYQCTPPRPPLNPVASLSDLNQASPDSGGTLDPTVSAASIPIATPPARHSRPGASKVIYLDFNGHTITGTNWNLSQGNSGDANYRPAVASYVAKPFSIDSDPATFNDAEQTVIIKVWERVAEDFEPFDVDVTTEEPASFTSNTGRILITDNVDANSVNMPSSTAAGVAYLDVFGSSNYISKYSPALVYANQNYNNEGYIAASASHEMGHNLSLSHDGTTAGVEYYQGHGSGETSWDALMGSAYSQNVTQWSKGEYFNANNLQDDLALIAGHLGYVPDDHADNNALATALTVNGLAVSGTGVISQTDEADRFSFSSGPGSISFTVLPYRSTSYTYGGNLDVALELYDSTGSVISSAKVDGITTASLNTNVNGGVYYLRVYGAATGNPFVNPPTGYTSYASLGQYTISGTVVSTNPVAPIFSGQPSNQTVIDGQPAQFSVTVGAYPAATYQWQRLAAGGGGWSNVSEGGVYSGPTTTRLNISAATLSMKGDQFRCVASNTVGSATSSIVALTVNPVVAPVISGLPANVTVNYGDSLSLVPVVTGTQPITYQWKKDGVSISGATNSAFFKSNVTGADGGTYALTATNAAGPVASSNVVVTVIPPMPPLIVVQPVSVGVVVGSSASFSAAATGSNPLTFQWFFNDQPISGATASVYVIQSSQIANAGKYKVVITNPAGSVTSNTATLNVTPLAGVIAASGGANQTYFIKGDGSLWGMGRNANGELGDGTSIDRGNPVQIANDVVGASTGLGFYSLFIKSDGSLWGTGFNGWGQLGDGSYSSRLSPKQIAINVVFACAGNTDSLFIKSDGSLWGMGGNSWGELGDGTTTGKLIPIQIATNIKAASSKAGSVYFIKADDSLWAIGYNGSGQLGDGTTQNRSTPVHVTDNVRAVAAGPNQCLFIKTDGSLWGMGRNDFGQLGDGSTTSRLSPIQISTGVVSADTGYQYSIFVKTDGSVQVMGSAPVNGLYTTNLTPVGISTGASDCTAGGYHDMFVKPDGSLWGFGSNSYGQLGSSQNSGFVYPTKIFSGQIVVPASPLQVIASDGTFRDGIRVNWAPAIGATKYEVWRSANNTVASAVRIADSVPISLYYDLTTIPGKKYFYWVKAINVAGASDYSSSDSGFGPSPSADFNQDGQTDILWQNVGSGDHGIWIMNGTVPAAWINLPVIAIAWQIVGTGDFNGDGQTDILWENVGSGDHGMWIMNGTVPAAWINLPSITLNWRIVGTGDFNGDGQTDILWENVSSGDRGMWIMNGTMPVAWINLPSIALNWRIVGTGDFNADGQTDILWENVGSGDRGMWIMDHTVPAAWINLPSIALNWRIAGTGDFNGDGQTDILWENVSSGDRGMWIMNATVPAAWINLPTLSLDWRIAQ